MAGGDPTHVAIAQPIFDALVQPGGFAHVGPVGAGHFTKMVHNGVEYGMMQAFGEGYELLRASELGIDVERAIEVWRHGSVVRSWLLDLLARALAEDPQLAGIKGWAEDSGEGRWTVQEAVRLAVPAPVLSASLYARFASRQDGRARDEGDRGAAQPVRRTRGKEGNVTAAWRRTTGDAPMTAPRAIPASSWSSAPPAT